MSKSLLVVCLAGTLIFGLPVYSADSNPAETPTDLDFSTLKFNPYNKNRQKMDIYLDGFYELKYSGRNFNPKNASGALLETIRNDPTYLKLPRDVIEGTPKVDPRLKMNLEGKLDDDLSVYLNVEQEPDFPAQYDVRVRKDKSELAFGTLDATFENGPFVSAKKQINGVRATSYDSDWSAIAASGQQRSDPKKYEGYGTGGSRIKLGNNSILEGSVSVFVNNQKLDETTDYRINYIDGEVNFLKIPPSNRDLVKVVYEFTNPIEDFLPISSRKTFFGAQGKWQTSMTGSWVTTPNKTTEVLWETVDEEQVTTNPTFQLRQLAIINTSLAVYLNGSRLTLNADFEYTSRTRALRIKRTLNELDRLTVDYQYYQTKPVQDVLIGDDSRGPYKLSATVVPNTPVDVWIGGEKAEPLRDYTIDPDESKIVFGNRVSSPQIIRVNYSAIQSQWVTPNIKENPFHVGATILNEYAANQDRAFEQTITAGQPSIISGASMWVPTENTPLVNTENLLVVINNQVVPTRDIVSIDPFDGRITVSQNIRAAIADIKLTYQFQQGIPVDYIFNGHTTISGEYVSGQDGFDIAKLPVRKRGLVGVWVWGSDLFTDGGNSTERPLQEGRDFTATIGESGQVLSIKFKKTGDTIGSEQSLLKKYPDANTRVRLRYIYNPPSASQVGAINQLLIGISAGGKLSKNWRIDTNIAVADNNLSRPRVTGSTTRGGNDTVDATFGKYGLDHKSIVENSEHVTIIDRVGVSHTLTKDEDYFINYELGTLKFRNNPPSATDTIQATYEFFDAGQTVAGANKQGVAFNIQTSYEQNDWLYTADFKTLDRNFVPIGTIPSNPGLTSVGGNVNWAPKDNNWDRFNLDYHRNIEYRTQNDAGGTTNLTRDELSSTTQLTHFNSDIYSRHKALVRYEIEDPRLVAVTGNKLHDIDTLTLRYEPEVIFGNGLYTTNLSALGLYSLSDVVDQKDPAKYVQFGVAYRSKFRPFKDVIVQRIGFEPFFKYSRTTSTKGSDTALSTYQQLGVNSDIVPIRAMLTNVAIDTDKTVSVPTPSNGVSATPDVQENRRININTGYKPFSWLDVGYGFSQIEQAGYLVQQSGSVETTNTSRINRYTPAEMALGLGWATQEAPGLWATLDGSYLRGSYSVTNRKENNRLKLSDRNWTQLSYNSFEPVDGYLINTVGYEKDDSTYSNNTPGSDITAASSVRRKSVKTAQWSLFPKDGWLTPFSNTLQWSDKAENRQDLEISKSASSNQTFTNIPEFNLATQLNYKSGALLWPNSTQLLGQFNGGYGYQKTDNKYTIDRYSTTGTTNTSFDTLSQQSRDNKYLEKNTYDAQFLPLNLMTFNGKVVTATEAYNRNVQVGVLGSLAKTNLYRAIGWEYSPTPLLSFTADVNIDNRRQWKSTQIDKTPAILQSTYENRLFTDVFARGLSTKILPVTWLIQTAQIQGWTPKADYLSLVLGAQFQTIAQVNEQVTSNLTTNTTFNQSGLKAGLTIEPIDALLFSGNATFFQLSQNGNGAQAGKELLLKATYLPIKTESSDVAIEFSRTDYYGFGFNALEQDNAAQSSHEDLQYSIRNRRDTIQVFSLKMNSYIPLNSASHVDRLVLTGEGYMKVIQDQIKGKNNYDITGFTFSSRIEFN